VAEVLLVFWYWTERS